MQTEKSTSSGIGRQHALPDLDPRHPDRVRTGLWMTIAGLIAILTLFLLGQHIDRQAEAEDQLAAQHGQEVIDLQLHDRYVADQVALAYEQGQIDAMRAVNQTPQGVELAQACLALGAARQRHGSELVQATPAKKGA
jgi:hypothetical protein